MSNNVTRHHLYTIPVEAVENLEDGPKQFLEDHWEKGSVWNVLSFYTDNRPESRIPEKTDLSKYMSEGWTEKKLKDLEGWVEEYKEQGAKRYWGNDQ